MFFRALALQAFGEENLSFKDYQDTPWKKLIAWRKIFNPFKWVEFLVLGTLYIAINFLLRLILIINSLLQILILLAFLLIATLLSLIITVLYLSQGLYTKNATNNTNANNPFKEI